MRAASPLDLRLLYTLFEKLPQLFDRLGRILFGEEMSAGERAARNVLSPTAPDGERSAEVCVPGVELLRNFTKAWMTVEVPSLRLRLTAHRAEHDTVLVSTLLQ
jgi:hypothetical protein